MTEQRIDRIVFCDGRRGTQTRRREPGGNWVLVSVCVTRQSDGSPCREVYSRKSDLFARVFSFGDLGNVTWDILS